MKRAKLNNDKFTALYCRLSKDDGTNNEIMSISTQKTMLKDYAKRNGFLNCQFYVDDGYSGTNYDRPLSDSLSRTYRTGKCQRSSQKTCHVWGGIILKRVHISRCFSPTTMYVTLLSMTAWTP